MTIELTSQEIKLLLALINNSAFKGTDLEAVLAVKQKLAKGIIEVD